MGKGKQKRAASLQSRPGNIVRPTTMCPRLAHHRHSADQVPTLCNQSAYTLQPKCPHFVAEVPTLWKPTADNRLRRCESTHSLPPLPRSPRHSFHRPDIRPTTSTPPTSRAEVAGETSPPCFFSTFPFAFASVLCTNICIFVATYETQEV